MRREGALMGGRAAGMSAGADAAAVAGVCPAPSGCWAGWAVGRLGGVAAGAEVEACLLLAALSSAGSSSSPATALPATCIALTCSHAFNTCSEAAREAACVPQNGAGLWFVGQAIICVSSGQARLGRSTLQAKTNETCSGSSIPMLCMTRSGTVSVLLCWPHLCRSSSAGVPSCNTSENGEVPTADDRRHQQR